ncbi:MAG TPA: hypothetical protein PLU71_02695 [Candidatus Dependentiae bacterium]|nr:hypothetical protein [Candidatus Dependentiae bacterium]HRQ62739.1 hypothetical protein [Candidatus Dependentiae bacterium]
MSQEHDQFDIKKAQTTMLAVLLDVQKDCNMQWHNLSDVQRKVQCYPFMAHLHALEKQMALYEKK